MQDKIEQGKIHVYTGNGKGKTTAALGLATRMLCSGGKVYMGQFIKGMEYGELHLPDYFPNLTIRQFGRDCFIHQDPKKEDFECALKGWEEVKEKLAKGEEELIILDELNVAIFYKLLPLEEVLQVIDTRNPKPELVITGRYAPEEIIQRGDLVTEMKEIKHYFHQGVRARKGIEY
ncbi:MAG: cob(I)yrinic acid a,c-diamide adenosyltransferase [Tissierellia bacterium]|nr:cob(I)yrinic acid a,c-diamide adenosyltransferase [Tissierellia bacterium]